jgi:hypothetical protein
LCTLAFGKPNRAEAARKLAGLRGRPPGQRVEDDRIKVDELARQFVAHQRKTARPKTVETYRQFLDDFCRFAPGMHARDLKPRVLSCRSVVRSAPGHSRATVQAMPASVMTRKSRAPSPERCRSSRPASPLSATKPR